MSKRPEAGPENPLESLLSSRNKGDLLILFHRNPGLIDSVEGIARRIGKKSTAIQGDISDLATASILKKKLVGKTEVYYLDRQKDKEAQEEVAKYIMNLGDKKQ